MLAVRGDAVCGAEARVKAFSLPGCELRERLVSDLVLTLSDMLRWSPDLFRQGRAGSGKVIVPEATLSTVLGFGVKRSGGLVEREALQGAGRRDLKVTVGGRVMVVEVKKWGRNDYKRIQLQLEGSWDRRVIGAVAVMLHDGKAATLVDRYRAVCLSRPGCRVTEVPAPAPILRRFRVRSTTASGFRAVCEHLLVHVPR